ncbi:DUF3846 domain-containing protein [Luteococcus sp.]|uniref:DUF3846 domain-containing protein n=1 Tax=Luteococcus sp. TaxID=1969402 RepID=UPI00373616EB
MSTTIQPQTMTVLVLDVDGTLSEQSVEVVDGDTQSLAIPRAVMGHGATVAQCIGEMFDMAVWCDEDGKVKELPSNPVATLAIATAIGLPGDFLVGRIVFVAHDEQGRQVSVTRQQHALLASHVEGAEVIHALLGSPSLIIG